MKSQDIQKGLKTRVFGRPLYCFEATGSTNDVALELARAGAGEGTAVSAEVQTKGRGRRGRKWLQVKGKGLALSLVLWPGLKPSEAAGITLAAAVAVARTLESLRLRPRIKWPNDILLSGKKVCGILTEAGDRMDNGTPIILGLGVNLNHSGRDFPPDLKDSATSLFRASGRKVDRVKFLQRLLLQLEEAYGWVVGRRFSRVLSEWRKRADCLGRQVKVQQGHHVFYGQALDLDETGALLVRTDHGMVEKVLSGDVTVLKF